MAREARMPELVRAMATSLALAAVTVGPTGGSPAHAATAWTGIRAASPQSGGPAFNQQSTPAISLRAHANNMIVTAENPVRVR